MNVIDEAAFRLYSQLLHSHLCRAEFHTSAFAMLWVKAG